MGGKARLTQEQAQDRVFRHGFDLVSEYTKRGDRHSFQCHRCNHIFETDFGNMSIGNRKCPNCDDLAKPMTEERLIKTLQDKGISLLEILDEGRLSNARIKVKHSCGHEWETAVRNVFYNTGCPMCNHGLPKTLDRLKTAAKDKGLTLTWHDGDFKGVGRVLLRCHCGCKLERNVDSLLYEKTNCPDCAKNERRAEIAKVLKDRGLFLLPNPKDDDKLLCSSCGHIWKGDLNYYASYRNDIKGCPKCADHGRVGTDFSKPMWLYYLRYDDGKRKLYKVGITKHDNILDRFQPRDAKFLTVVRKQYYDYGRDAYDHEQQLLKDFAQYRYQGEPVLKSGGDTELLTVDVLFLDKDNPYTQQNIPLDTQTKAS